MSTACPSLSVLYVVCDVQLCRRSGWLPVDFAAACVEGGARLIQVRAKNLPSMSLLEAALAVAERTRAFGTTIIVNDRADIARFAGASGVHVGQDDLPPAAVRGIVGNAALVGLSTHTLEQARRAAAEPISYLAVGPVFETATKDTGYAAIGLQRVRDVVRAVPGRVPVVAIGGITLERARAVIEMGAASVAVASDLFVGGSPTTRVQAYLDRLPK